MDDPIRLSAGNEDFTFDWDVERDSAKLSAARTGAEIWTGSLLPLFWCSDRQEAVEATLDPASPRPAGPVCELALLVGHLGRARLRVRLGREGVKFERLAVTWSQAKTPALTALYFGAKILSPSQRRAAPSLDVPFWPTWRAEGYGIASAKTNPMQSFFRSWDFGHTNIPLGSFGPAMGTPYAAAFPRPIYAGCMGGRHGWLCLGVGAVPDGALTFQVRARSGALESRYREDLWDADPATERVWEDPLWLAWGDSAWAAYRGYFEMFGPPAARSAHHQKSFGGTWGDFRLGTFDLKASAERAGTEFGASLLCIDDPWEATKGSGTPNPRILPHFKADLDQARQKGLGIGIWMPTGWVEDPAAAGLTTDDLMIGRDQAPVTGNWSVDPHEPTQAFFCLDPSSARAREFLRVRTGRVIRDYRPTLLKLDFGYGFPGPDACQVRDRAYRGERLAWGLMRVIADAARAVDPTITILGYSLHPLWDAVQDQCSLDDLGDAGVHEATAHGQWSVWAALAGLRGVALMGSSGYHWTADEDVILNTAVLGAPGVNLPRVQADGSPVPPAWIARRRGIFRWYRRTTRWEPLWLDSRRGSIEAEPGTQNWGRLEPADGGLMLTALALRQPTAAIAVDPRLRGLTWKGRWAILAQENRSIFASAQTALIAFGPGFIALPRDRRPARVRAVLATGETDHRAWEWRDSCVHLTIDESLAEAPLLGFLVEDA